MQPRVDLVFTNFDCSLGKDAFWPRTVLDPDREVISVYAVDALGARSPATEITLVFEESRLAITTPDRLPSGDVITLEGEREYSTTIEWQLEGSTGLVFSGRQCTLPDDVEIDLLLRLRLHSRGPEGEPARHAAAEGGARRGATRRRSPSARARSSSTRSRSCSPSGRSPR